MTRVKRLELEKESNAYRQIMCMYHEATKQIKDSEIDTCKAMETITNFFNAVGEMYKNSNILFVDNFNIIEL